MVQQTSRCCLPKFLAKNQNRSGCGIVDTNTDTREKRMIDKKKDQSYCINCEKKDDVGFHLFVEKMILKEDGSFGGFSEKKCSLITCAGCRYYSYCGKRCQISHCGECQQLSILKHTYRRKAKEIREAILRGEDPKDIDRLQQLRTELGLNRPKEDYDDLLLRFSDGDDYEEKHQYLTARKDRTVHIGSTPNRI
mmetsp:Transcript_17550/g.17702  ORF Transcript_17550/g.17702 Transcript_17550/m.17702 type:complete len:194 (-) Transcript_17550:221-802(-)